MQGCEILQSACLWLSVCLSTRVSQNCMSKLCEMFWTRDPWPWFSPSLMTLQCVMHRYFLVLQMTSRSHIMTTHAHTRLTAVCPGLPGWAGTRKVKPIWILLKQETASGSGIRWTVCKSAPRLREKTTPAPHHSVVYRPDALPAAQPTASKHWPVDEKRAYTQSGQPERSLMSTIALKWHLPVIVHAVGQSRPLSSLLRRHDADANSLLLTLSFQFQT